MSKRSIDSRLAWDVLPRDQETVITTSGAAVNITVNHRKDMTQIRHVFTRCIFVEGTWDPDFSCAQSVSLPQEGLHIGGLMPYTVA